MKWIQKYRWLFLLVPALLIVIVAMAVMREPALPVRAEAVRLEDIVNRITTNGKMEPVENFEARALAPASVKRVRVKEGDKVRAGQLLVQLEDADARTAAARALSQLRAAEAEFAAIGKGGSQDEVLTNQALLVKAQTERDAAERNLTALKRLFETGSASAGEVQESENRLKRAVAEVQLLEQKRSGRYSNPEVVRAQARLDEAKATHSAALEILANANVTAPRAGTVYSVPVKTGNYVQPGDLLVQVADITKVQVRAFVDEPDVAKLKVGQPVEVTWDALPGRTWDGEVSQVPATVTPRGTRNVGEVLVSVDNNDRQLLPNVNVNVIITTSSAEDALTLSREAVMQQDGRRYVFVIEDSRLKRIEVETAISTLTRIQIKKGVKEKTLVALGAVNAQPLVDGRTVKVVEP